MGRSDARSMDGIVGYRAKGVVTMLKEDANSNDYYNKMYFKVLNVIFIRLELMI